MVGVALQALSVMSMRLKMWSSTYQMSSLSVTIAPMRWKPSRKRTPSSGAARLLLVTLPPLPAWSVPPIQSLPLSCSKTSISL